MMKDMMRDYLALPEVRFLIAYWWAFGVAFAALLAAAFVFRRRRDIPQPTAPCGDLARRLGCAGCWLDDLSECPAWVKDNNGASV